MKSLASKSVVMGFSKGFVLVLLISSLSVAAVSDKARALNLPVMSVEPERTVADPNEVFSVNVTVTGAVDVYGWEFKLGYDIDVLIPQLPPKEGPFLKSGGYSTYIVYAHDPVRGVVRVASTRLGEVPGASGNGTLATVKFYAFQVGDCVLDLFDTVLFNSGLEYVEHTVRDGCFTTPMFADLLHRGAWPKCHHFSITRDKAGVQILFGMVSNLGNWASFVRVEFKVFDDFSVLKDVFHAKYVVDGVEVRVVSGESVTLSVSLWENRENSWKPGEYYVEATCVCSAGLTLWDYGVSEKTFSFTVVP